MLDPSDPQQDPKSLPMNAVPETHHLVSSIDQRFLIDWFYYFGKARYVLRIIHYLERLKEHPDFNLQFITIIHQPQGWIMRIRPNQSWSLNSILNFQAFMNEVGSAHKPNQYIQPVFSALEQGESILNVRQRYCISAIHHGQPRTDDVLMFCEQVIEKLGYCPHTCK